MCGIAGVLDLNNTVDLRVLQSMNDIAKHRGPDDEGYCLVSGNRPVHARGRDTIGDLAELPALGDVEGEFFLGMGHRRLSILDLTACGHQPMESPDGKTVIIFNGEVYNYLEIRSELEKKGYRFRTTSDTEVILSAYSEWGEACVTRFNGMWGFAIWDAEKSRLFCSRDRLGAKPFNYYFDGAKFVFGSEIKQVICDRAIPRVMDEEALSESLMYMLSDHDKKTWIKDIFQLPPAHNLTLEVDLEHRKVSSFATSRYWTLDTTYFEKDADYVQLVGEQFSRACNWRMRSDVPVGALLSGGLDSSCIVTEISNQLKQAGKEAEPLNTFTACYEDSPENDESHFAHLVNENSGAKEHFVYPRIDDFPKAIESLIWHSEGLTFFSILGSMSVVEEVAKNGIKVCINGQGGDETMFGYERYYAFYFKDLIKRFQWRKAAREFKLATRHSKLTVKMLFQYLFYFTVPFVRNGRQKRNAKKYFGRAVPGSLNYAAIKGLLYPKSLQQLQGNEITAVQLRQILRWDDRMYMAHSVESRVPFIDYQYIELAVRIPVKYKIENGYTKMIMRKYIDGKMPGEVTWRTNKMGFQAPTERFVESLPEGYMEELFDNARSAKYFNIAELKKLCAEVPNHQNIEKFMSVELFMRLFDVQPAS